MTYLTEEMYGGPPEGFVVDWECEPPDEDVDFQVVRQAWNEDMTVRTIYEIKVYEISAVYEAPWPA
jgi:hypothetical protein